MDKKNRLLSNSTFRIAIMVIIDIIIINFSSAAAIYIRALEYPLEDLQNLGFFDMLQKCCIPGTLISIIMLILFRLYSTAWEYAGERELISIAFASTCSAAFYSVLALSLKCSFPRSFPYIFTVILFLMLSASRLIYRRLLRVKNIGEAKNIQKKRTMIIGAGTAGVMAIREFEESVHSQNKVVCFIDDDVNKIHTRIRGIKVVGGRDKILTAAKKYNIEEIIFCIPSASHTDRNQILELCTQTAAQVKSLPTLVQLANGEVTLNQIKSVSIEDLLGRTPVHIDNSDIARKVQGNTVLVTGGGGSIGSELCRQLAQLHPARLVIFDIYENNAYDIQQELKSKHPELDLVVLIGSVREDARVRFVFETYRPALVCHAAAHKHVPLMEDSPAESIKNNVFGTYNVARAAADYGTGLFVLISTDKAVNPTNVMGASKRLCEMVIQSMNGRNSTKFIAVRFGNVLGSNGSVIPLFKKQIAAGGPVTVTDKRVTRFFMTIPEAVSLILQAASYAEGGEVFVLDMGSPVRIDDMARKMIRLSGFEPDVDIKIEYTGLRPGEKLYEELLLKSEGLQKTDNRLIYIGHQKMYSPEEIEDILETLRGVIYAPKEQVRECMLSIIKEPVDNMYAQIPIPDTQESVTAESAV